MLPIEILKKVPSSSSKPVYDRPFLLCRNPCPEFHSSVNHMVALTALLW
jgi:hypothetical protein